MNYNCSIFWDLRNLQEQVKKAFCYQKLFWPFTVWINCSSDFKVFENYQPSASNFKCFSRSLEQFFLTVSQNNFGNKIPLFFKDSFSSCAFIWNVLKIEPKKVYSMSCQMLTKQKGETKHGSWKQFHFENRGCRAEMDTAKSQWGEIFLTDRLGGKEAWRPTHIS